MKKLLFIFLIFSFLLMSIQQVSAQNLPTVFDTTNFPQWAKDLRRFDIITFGIFPFCLFFTSITTDMIRWNEANGMNFSDRHYAPWPLKPAGAYERTTDEHFRNITIAATAAASVALLDLLIVKTKHTRERRRLDAKQSGTYTIERIRLNEPQIDDDTDDTDETDDDIETAETPANNGN